MARPNLNDFNFDSPRTIFGQANPLGALDRDFSFPHAGNPIDMPGIGVGVTRMAFFLQEARVSSAGAPMEFHSLSPPCVHSGPTPGPATPHEPVGFAVPVQ